MLQLLLVIGAWSATVIVFVAFIMTAVSTVAFYRASETTLTRDLFFPRSSAARVAQRQMLLWFLIFAAGGVLGTVCSEILQQW